jgi:hypothetical protein
MDIRHGELENLETAGIARRLRPALTGGDAGKDIRNPSDVLLKRRIHRGPVRGRMTDSTEESIP